MQEVWKEIIENYISRGAPGDQGVLVAMLRQLQQHWGGCLPTDRLASVAALLGVKENFLLAVIRRIPSLRVGQSHVLELCAGPNCGTHTALAAAAEKLCRQAGVTFRYMPCQRLCGKGPNMKFDGNLYHRVDEALLKQLLLEKEAK